MVREEDKLYRTMNGGHTHNVCAWCGYHKFYLTTKELKKKECLRKQCGALVKFDDHQFWEMRKRKHLRCKGAAF